MPESGDFTIETRRIRWVRDGGERVRTQWLREASVDNGPWRYLLGAQKIVGTKSWIVRVQDTQTGEVMDRRSPGRNHLAVQKELIRRLHEKAGAS